MHHISSLRSLDTAIADILSKGVALTLRKVLFDSRVVEECKEQLCERKPGLGWKTARAKEAHSRRSGGEVMLILFIALDA